MTRPAATVQTLDRGLRLLELLADAPDGLAVAQLSAALGVHRAIVYRLLATLAAHRLVQRGEDGRHRLGTGLVRLARDVSPRLQAAALPELGRLAEDVGATATLTVADGEEGVALAAVEPRNTHIHVAYRPGLRHPLEVGAPGRAILIGRPAATGDPAAVARARRRGYVVSRGEIQPGASGLAAPVPGVEASVGVVSLVDLGDEVAARVIAAARAIAAALG
ncbi:MAG TPA: helix-turn-helix domain-containing protein [Gaiellaceae bacterium]